jgi:hypothetical protein
VKRTKRIDGEQPVILGKMNGEVVHTTRADMEMSPGDKEEMLHRVRKQAAHGSVAQMAKEWQAKVAGFFLKSICDLAPTNVSEAFGHGNMAIFEAWRSAQGYEFSMDGLRPYIKKNGRVIADMPVTVSGEKLAELLYVFRQLMVNGQ